MTEYFEGIGRIPFEGPDSEHPLAFRIYDKDRIVMGTPHGRPPAARGLLLAQLLLGRG